jgi:hypothetical protein
MAFTTSPGTADSSSPAAHVDQFVELVAPDRHPVNRNAHGLPTTPPTLLGGPPLTLSSTAVALALTVGTLGTAGGGGAHRRYFNLLMSGTR